MAKCHYGQRKLNQARMHTQEGKAREESDDWNIGSEQLNESNVKSTCSWLKEKYICTKWWTLRNTEESPYLEKYFHNCGNCRRFKSQWHVQKRTLSSIIITVLNESARKQVNKYLIH